MLRFQNSKRSVRLHRAACKWGAFALLAVVAIAAATAVIPHIGHLPSFDAIASIGGSGTLLAFPVIGAMGFHSGRGLFFMDKADDAGGGGNGEYTPKDDFEKAVLSSVKELQASLAKVQSGHGKDIADLKQASDDVARKLVEFQKNQMTLKSRALRIARPGQVSQDCARHLGAVALAIALKTGKISEHSDTVEAQVKEILGVEWKSSITASDIPLPTEYSGEIVELVSMYGKARLYGTVYPLGAGTVKLPRLSTDPTFGLIGMSVTVTEKSPQAAFVTFAAEKFGGLVRLPSEIDEDSIIPMGQFLARYAARQMALCEDSTFFKSDGTDTANTYNGAVKGLCFSVIDNSKVVQMASTKTHYSDATLANLRALRAVPDEAALETAAYYMHPTFEQLLSTFNTGGDRPYNPQAQIAGFGANPITTGPTLDGFPIRWVNTMPAYSTAANVSKVFILFGDPSYQYLGIRGGMRFASSSEAGFTTDEILVRALERYQIGLMALGAVAGLETAAS